MNWRLACQGGVVLGAVIMLAALPARAGWFSSDESDMYDIFKCGKAATMMGRTAEAREAGRKLAPYANKVQGSMGRMSMEFNQRFMDEYGSGRSLDTQAVLDLYGSRTCKKLYAP